MRIRALTAALAALLTPPAHADWFGTGDNRFEIPFVTIGSPGNSPDLDNATNPNFNSAPNPSGSVSYEYRIGKYEVPEEAIRKANAASLLAGTALNLTLDTRGPKSQLPASLGPKRRGS